MDIIEAQHRDLEQGRWEEMPFPMQMPPQPGAPASVQSISPDAPKKSAPEGNVMNSPIVGTFYAAPSPEKPPFVTVGKQVSKGDVLFIIESIPQ